MTALLGGTFNPPHNGHVALAATAEERFGEEVVVLVAVRPGHKEVELDGDVRAQLTQAAFPHREVETDPYGRTVDMLKAGRWREPRFLIGADEFCDFLTWKDPEGVVARARVGKSSADHAPSTGVSALANELHSTLPIQNPEVPLPKLRLAAMAVAPVSAVAGPLRPKRSVR